MTGYVLISDRDEIDHKVRVINNDRQVFQPQCLEALEQRRREHFQAVRKAHFQALSLDHFWALLREHYLDEFPPETVPVFFLITQFAHASANAAATWPGSSAFVAISGWTSGHRSGDIDRSECRKSVVRKANRNVGQQREDQKATRWTLSLRPPAAARGPRNLGLRLDRRSDVIDALM
jgi:hypothetical protein